MDPFPTPILNEDTPVPDGDIAAPDTHSARFVYQMAILMAMNRLPGKHIYEGTVPAAVIAKRRAANKKARAQRKINRQR